VRSSAGSPGPTTRFAYLAAFAVREVEVDFELAFLVDAVLALDALLPAVAPVAAFLAVPRLALDLAFFSVDFLPAYVFLGAASAFFAAAGLAAGFGGLAEAAAFLGALAEDALVGAVFEDGALRPAEDLVVAALLVAVFDFDPGFVAGFEAVFVTGVVFEVLEVGLFSFASSEALTVFGASFTRPDGPLGSEKIPFSAPTAIALLSCVTCAFPISSL